MVALNRTGVMGRLKDITALTAALLVAAGLLYGAGHTLFGWTFSTETHAQQDEITSIKVRVTTLEEEYVNIAHRSEARDSLIQARLDSLSAQNWFLVQLRCDDPATRFHSPTLWFRFCTFK